jgi:hypothetical protein
MLKSQMKSVMEHGSDVSHPIRVDDSDAEMVDILTIPSASLSTETEKLSSV